MRILLVTRHRQVVVDICIKIGMLVPDLSGSDARRTNGFISDDRSRIRTPIGTTLDHYFRLPVGIHVEDERVFNVCGRKTVVLPTHLAGSAVQYLQMRLAAIHDVGGTIAAEVEYAGARDRRNVGRRSRPHNGKVVFQGIQPWISDKTDFQFSITVQVGNIHPGGPVEPVVQQLELPQDGGRLNIPAIHRILTTPSALNDSVQVAVAVEISHAGITVGKWRRSGNDCGYYARNQIYRHHLIAGHNFQPIAIGTKIVGQNVHGNRRAKRKAVANARRVFACRKSGTAGSQQRTGLAVKNLIPDIDFRPAVVVEIGNIRHRICITNVVTYNAGAHVFQSAVVLIAIQVQVICHDHDFPEPVVVQIGNGGRGAAG